MPESPTAPVEQHEEGETTEEETPVVEPTRTLEEVEATWSHRMSERDRAHNAAEQALRDELANAKATADAARRELTSKAQGDMTEVDRVAAERDALREELAAEKSARVIAEMKTKYPKVAAELGDKAFTVYDAGELATFETKFSTEPQPAPTRTDPNAAPRKGAPAEKPNPTSDDLKADLARYGPDFAAQLRG